MKKNKKMNRTVVIGLGNPILSDDSVGIHAARALYPRLEGMGHVEVKELYGGGLVLMEAMAGFKMAVVIDAMVTGAHEPGSVLTMYVGDTGGADDFKCSRNLACGHDTGLAEALEVGRSVGYVLPSEVKVIGIEAADVVNFGENLSPPVSGALPLVVEMVLAEVMKDMGPVKQGKAHGR